MLPEILVLIEKFLAVGAWIGAYVPWSVRDKTSSALEMFAVLVTDQPRTIHVYHLV